MTVNELLQRARSAVGTGVRYKLGKGGRHPSASSPADGHRCDCTGFVAWCFGMSRKTNHAYYVGLNHGWISTTAVWSDIGHTTNRRFADYMFFASLPIPGAIVVYPDRGGHQGHIAIVSGINRGIHCSATNDSRFSDAIQETDIDFFLRRSDTRYGWFSGLMP